MSINRGGVLELTSRLIDAQKEKKSLSQKSLWKQIQMICVHKWHFHLEEVGLVHPKEEGRIFAYELKQLSKQFDLAKN